MQVFTSVSGSFPISICLFYNCKFVFRASVFKIRQFSTINVMWVARWPWSRLSPFCFYIWIADKAGTRLLDTESYMRSTIAPFALNFTVPLKKYQWLFTYIMYCHFNISCLFKAQYNPMHKITAIYWDGDNFFLSYHEMEKIFPNCFPFNSFISSFLSLFPSFRVVCCFPFSFFLSFPAGGCF